MIPIQLFAQWVKALKKLTQSVGKKNNNNMWFSTALRHPVSVPWCILVGSSMKHFCKFSRVRPGRSFSTEEASRNLIGDDKKIQAGELRNTRSNQQHRSG